MEIRSFSVFQAFGLIFHAVQEYQEINYLHYLYSKLKHSFDITFFISNKMSVILYKVYVREEVEVNRGLHLDNHENKPFQNAS